MEFRRKDSRVETGVRKQLTSNHLCRSLQQADSHDRRPERDARSCRVRLPAPGAEFDVTKWGQDVGERTGTRGADELEYNAEVTG